MNGITRRLSMILTPLLIVLGATCSASAQPRTATELASQRAEIQVRNLLDPLLQKYCQEECKLLGVKAAIDLSVPDEVAPGFEDVDPSVASRLEPSSAEIRLLVDEKLGPVSRKKLLDLLQQYLDTLEFPVKITTQVAHFPQPAVAAGKVTELRERVAKRFRESLEGLFTQFCPETCLLADFNLRTEVVNLEEAQYGSSGEYFEDGGVAIRVKEIGASVLVDEILTADERSNILEMAKLRTNEFKNVALTAKALRFPRPWVTGPNGEKILAGGTTGRNGGREIASEKSERNERNDSRHTTDQKSQHLQNSETRNSESSSENNERNERYERYEKIERVENGDAVQEQLKKFQTYALIFGCGVLSLLIFIALAAFRNRGNGGSLASMLPRWSGASEASAGSGPSDDAPGPSGTGELARRASMRIESDRFRDELLEVFAQSPKVAKQVFARVLQEEGVETTAAYLHLFGESVVMDLLRDPSLQADLNELMEYFSRNPVELKEEDTLQLLKRLHNRTVVGKLSIIGQRSSMQFDFLADMDGLQIFELVRNESMTVKAILLTQCDNAKRAQIFSQLDEDSRMKLLAELSRIDYLPRDYIANVANALKRKRHENPKLNTEALPGSEVLVNLLERAPTETQMSLIKNLERQNPDSARTLKNKLVSVSTLRYLRDSQLLEVVLSLRHDELLQFLKAAPSDIRNHILTKTPRDLGEELVDELGSVQAVSREQYHMVERKVLNRMKVMASEGLISLAETNDRMFSDFRERARAVPGSANQAPSPTTGSDGRTQAVEPTGTGLKRASGW